MKNALLTHLFIVAGMVLLNTCSFTGSAKTHITARSDTVPPHIAGLWINEGEQISLSIDANGNCEIRYTEMEAGETVTIPGSAFVSGKNVTLRLGRTWWYGTVITYSVRETESQWILWLTATDDKKVKLSAGGKFGFYRQK